MLLTRRSRHLRSHRGEVSFPGGRIDPGETPAGAALREAFEEVGLDPGAPRVVGELDHLSTVSSRSHIVPVVATLPGRPIVHPASAEVERVLHVPLADLLRPGTYREERWGSPPLDRSDPLLRARRRDRVGGDGPHARAAAGHRPGGGGVTA